MSGLFVAPLRVPTWLAGSGQALAAKAPEFHLPHGGAWRPEPGMLPTGR